MWVLGSGVQGLGFEFRGFGVLGFEFRGLGDFGFGV